jgi:small-conductance mechanosensitive channel
MTLPNATRRQAVKCRLPPGVFVAIEDGATAPQEHDMEKLINPETVGHYLTAARDWVLNYVLVMGTLQELGVILIAGTLAWLISRPLRKRFLQREERNEKNLLLKTTWHLSATIVQPAIWLILQWAAVATASAAGWRYGLMTVTSSLLAAWIVIRIAASFVRDRFWRHNIAITAWIIAALNIVGLLDPTIAILDSASITLGSVRLSAYTVMKGILALGVLFWGATIVSNVFESRIKAARNLTPSVQVLLSKLFKIILITLVMFAGISLIGIDITAFAVVGGAIGVGIGFGLQKIVGNLISGLILLMDKSIKPGDVIAIGENYGSVESLGARYVSVSTRDGIEHLIPNEELIVNRVENWSHTHNLYRMRTQIGIHYKSDVRKAMELCIEAASETDRVLTLHPPVCQIRAFGDNSVNLELRYWINDPMNGRQNVNGEILLKIWDKFHEHGIEIPYPQRDLHLRTPEVKTIGDIVKLAPA